MNKLLLALFIFLAGCSSSLKQRVSLIENQIKYCEKYQVPVVLDSIKRENKELKMIVTLNNMFLNKYICTSEEETYRLFLKNQSWADKTRADSIDRGRDWMQLVRAYDILLSLGVKKEEDYHIETECQILLEKIHKQLEVNPKEWEFYDPPKYKTMGYLKSFFMFYHSFPLLSLKEKALLKRLAQKRSLDFSEWLTITVDRHVLDDNAEVHIGTDFSPAVLREWMSGKAIERLEALQVANEL